MEAATVDHALRPDSASEAAHVANICADLGIPHRIMTVDVGAGNLHDSARRARYRALAEWAQERQLVAVATAHHADDQAETLLMRLNRASGLRGLASIRAQHTVGTDEANVTVIRPLLFWRKAELEQLVADAGLQAITDPSNADPRFDRARVRAGLASAEWLDTAAIARSAANLADAEAALNWAVDLEWANAVSEADGAYTYSNSGTPEIVVQAIIERFIALVGGGSPRGGEVAALAERLRGGGKATLGGAIVEHSGGTWTVRRETGRR